MTVREQHELVYSAPRLYDLAFSYRDYARECDFLAEAFGRASDRELRSVLELAAGTGRHAHELASRGVAATALDLSPDMTREGLRIAQSTGTAVDHVVADMTAFEPPAIVDLAICMLDSASYLHTNRAVLSHLSSVAAALHPGGVYLLELAHPRDLYGGQASTVDQWRVETPEGTLHVSWHHDQASFDPITQLTTARVVLELRNHEQVVQRIEDSCRLRSFSRNEVEALVAASGCFEIADVFGALDTAVPLSNDPAAWRMVVSLRRN